MSNSRVGWRWDVEGDDDPTVTPVTAPIGTQFRRTTDGALFVKTGPGGTDWTLLPGAAKLPVSQQLADFTATTGFLYKTTPLALDITMLLPAAAGKNGQLWGIQSDPVFQTFIGPSGTDSIGYGSAGAELDVSGGETKLFVSDGVSNWILLSTSPIPVASQEVTEIWDMFSPSDLGLQLFGGTGAALVFTRPEGFPLTQMIGIIDVECFVGFACQASPSHDDGTPNPSTISCTQLAGFPVNNEWRFYLQQLPADGGNNFRVFIGLFHPESGSGVDVVEPNRGFWFECGTALGTNWFAVGEGPTSKVSTDTGVPVAGGLVDPANTLLAIAYDPTPPGGAEARFYIGDVLVATILLSATGFPGSVGPNLAVFVAAANIDPLRTFVDYTSLRYRTDRSQ